MDSPTLDELLADYENTLKTWSEEEKNAEQALFILKSRDFLYQALQQDATPSTDFLNNLEHIDDKLKKERQEILLHLDFEHCRDGLNITKEQWWWTLDQSEDESQEKAYGWVFERESYVWLFEGISIGAWTVSLALLLDISRRFLLGGASVAGLSFLTLSHIATFLTVRKDLSRVTKGSLNIFFSNSSQWQSEIKCASTISLASVFLFFWLNLPKMSTYYNNQGYRNQSEKQFATAERNYQRAIALHPENKSAHYNLGTLYEDIRNIDEAIAQYNVAIEDQGLDAYNNLARLYVYQGESLDQAVHLLQQAIALDQEKDEFQRNKSTTFALYKNLGWARLKQGHWQEAEPLLKEAINVAGGAQFWDETQSNFQQASDASVEYIYSLGSAYCLLAQTLEEQNGSDTVQAWKYCCQYADPTKINEDTWLLEARKKLEEQGQSPEESSCKSTNPLDNSPS